jgi:hypothetical protein
MRALEGLPTEFADYLIKSNMLEQVSLIFRWQRLYIDHFSPYRKNPEILPGLNPQIPINLIKGFGFTAVKLMSRTETQQNFLHIF